MGISRKFHHHPRRWWSYRLARGGVDGKLSYLWPPGKIVKQSLEMSTNNGIVTRWYVNGGAVDRVHSELHTGDIVHKRQQNSSLSLEYVKVYDTLILKNMTKYMNVGLPTVFHLAPSMWFLVFSIHPIK